jgi:hypothetical protein
MSPTSGTRRFLPSIPKPKPKPRPKPKPTPPKSSTGFRV